MAIKWLEKRRALPLLVVAGLVMFIVIKNLGTDLKHDESSIPPIVVNALELMPYQAMPRVIGYGKAEPAIDFQEKSEVAGRVVSVSPLLQKGELVKAGTEMLRIDDADYRLALASSRANLESAKASLAELKQTEANLKSNKQLIEQKLALTKKELDRFEKLIKQNSVSQSSLDTTRNNYLQQQQELTSTRNALALIPSQRTTAQSVVKAAESAVAIAERDLDQTQLVLPYDARISEVFIENNQFVSAGASLFSAHAIDKFEIEVQLPLEQFAHFTRPAQGNSLTMDNAVMQKVIKSLELQARITLVGGPKQAKWSGTVERISDTLNPQSRTLGVIITVDTPYQKVSPGVRPPIMEGMYMQVELLGKSGPYLLFPRKALHEGDVYSLTSDNRLKRIAIADYLLAGDVVMLESQALAGTQVITSELFPAVDGMLVEPREDEQATQLLQQFARGEGAIR